MENTNKTKTFILITYDELYSLLKEVYRNGYATYEFVDTGLEPLTLT
jgi:hypothetical protein